MNFGHRLEALTLFSGRNCQPETESMNSNSMDFLFCCNRGSLRAILHLMRIQCVYNFAISPDTIAESEWVAIYCFIICKGNSAKCAEKYAPTSSMRVHNRCILPKVVALFVNMPGELSSKYGQTSKYRLLRLFLWSVWFFHKIVSASYGAGLLVHILCIIVVCLAGFDQTSTISIAQAHYTKI